MEEFENKEFIAKSKTKYDYEAIKKFNQVHSYSRPMTWIVSVIALLILIYAVVDNAFESYYRILIGAISTIWFIEMLTLPIISAKRAYKTSRLSQDAEVEVAFYDDEIKMTTLKSGEIVGETVIKYAEVYKIKETKDYMYIYISGNQSILCGKQNVEGDLEKVKDILVQKVAKYKRK